jgi:hypothetical protein
MTSIRLHNWFEIRRKFRNSDLLLGNGASIAFHKNFDYSSLYNKAKSLKFINREIESVFGRLKSKNFEYILKMLLQTHLLNKDLHIKDDKTSYSYSNVRDILIKTIMVIHPLYQDVKDQFSSFAKFFARFRMVISLNYDLLTYWARMSEMGQFPNKEFKDCFKNGGFVRNWKPWLKSYKKGCKPVLFFYPHGSLAFSVDQTGQESKIKSQFPHNNLKSVINHSWRQRHQPLFISEGNSHMKLASIYKSQYLSTVYTEVLPFRRTSLVIFGWSFGDGDNHILEAVAKSPLKRIAVSVYKKD